MSLATEARIAELERRLDDATAAQRQIETAKTVGEIEAELRDLWSEHLQAITETKHEYAAACESYIVARDEAVAALKVASERAAEAHRLRGLVTRLGGRLTRLGHEPGPRPDSVGVIASRQPPVRHLLASARMHLDADW